MQIFAEKPPKRPFCALFDKAGLLVYNAEQSITRVKSARGKESVQWKKTRFKLNICGVDVTVSGDVDRDGAEAIAERVRVRMEEGFKQRLRRDHRKRRSLRP